MAPRKNMMAWVFILGLGWSAITGCATGRHIKLPETNPDKIRVYKEVTVWANEPSAKATGVRLEKDDLFSIMITGKVNTSPRRHPGRWEKYFGRLQMMLDQRYYGAPPGNRTLESLHSGEIKFYVRDGWFDYSRGKAAHPDNYDDNRGAFKVIIIVWKEKDWDYIGEFFRQIKVLNPENRSAQVAFKQFELYKSNHLAEIETTKAVAETRKRIDALKQSPPPESESSSPTPADQASSGEIPAAKSENESEVAALERRLAALMAQLAELEEIKQQLSVEKEKTARLSEELDATTKSSENGDPLPPVLLIASPKDGQKTSEGSVRLAGVAQDNQGLASVRIYLNDRPVPDDQSRGLTILPAEVVKRREFNESLALNPGINRIRVRATDTSGRVVEQVIEVLREERRYQIWAVVIGIDNYPRIAKLKYAVNDARAFYDLLVRNNRIPAENIFLVTDDRATLTNLRSTLGTKLKQNAGRDDMVIIYFAGHGATERDAMSPDGDGLEKYILPYDADPEDLYATALPMREISHILNRIQSERLVFIADACYSGASGGRTISIGGNRANISDGYLERITRGKGRVIITASGANEVSVENDTLQHGVFTYYLVEGLRGRADFDRDGLITVDEAYRYVSDAVPNATSQEQHPVKKGVVEGQLVLGIVK